MVKKVYTLFALFKVFQLFQPILNDCTTFKLDIPCAVQFYAYEIIDYSAGHNKDAALVYRAFARVKARLDDITLFHTDRGNEFKNKIIDEVLDTFKIKRFLSMKGCPYDNAVAEATFKIFKTQFANNYHFESLEQLEIMLADYVN